MTLSIQNMIDQAEKMQRRKDAITLHRIEGYEFTPEQTAMFEMFDREEFTAEQRIDYIKQKYEQAGIAAAE